VTTAHQGTAEQTVPLTDVGGRTSRVVRDAIALMVSTVATSALGMVFWTVAARLAPPHALGVASAESAAVTLLAGLATLDLTSVMPRFLPMAGRATGKYISRGYAATAAVGLILALGYALSGLGHDFIPRTPWGIAFFAMSVILLGILIVQDGVLAALRRATWVPFIKAGFAFAKVGLLPVLVAVGLGQSGSGLFFAWSAPVVVAVAVVTVLVFIRVVPRHLRGAGDRGAAPGWRDIASFMSAQYLNSLVFNVAYGVPPVLVATVLGARQAAYFTIPWLVGTSVIALLANISMSLVAEVSNDNGHLHTHLRRAMRLNALVAGGGGAVLVAAAPLVMMVFGGEYVTEGTTTLRLLALGLPFAGITFLYTALNTIDKHVWRSLAAETVWTIVFIGGGVLGLHRYGTAGLAVAFDVAQALIGVIVLPSLVRTFRTRPDGVRPPKLAPLGRGGFRGVDAFVGSDIMLLTFSFPTSIYASSAARSRDVAPSSQAAGAGPEVKLALVPQKLERGVYVSRGLPDDDADRPAPEPPAPERPGEVTMPLHHPSGDGPVAGAAPDRPVTGPIPKDAVVTMASPGGPDVTMAIPRQPDATMVIPHEPDATMVIRRDAGTGNGPGSPGDGKPPAAAPPDPTGPRRRALPPPDLTTVLLAGTGLVLGVLTPILVRLPVGVLPKAVLVLLFAFLAPGAGVLSLVRLGDAVASWAMAYLLSISLFALVAVSMVWARLWYPYAALLLLAVPTVALSGRALVSALRRRPPSEPRGPVRRPPGPSPVEPTAVLSRLAERGPEPTMVIPISPAVASAARTPDDVLATAVLPAVGRSTDAAVTPVAEVSNTFDEPAVDLARRLVGIQRTLEGAVATGTMRRDDRDPDDERRPAAEQLSGGPSPWRPLALLLEFGPLLAALGLWGYSLGHSHLPEVGDYGLLTAVHPTFIAAVVVVCTGFVGQLARRDWRGWVLVLYLVTTVLILRATVPLLIDAPEYAWTYKHLAVVEFIRTTGSVVDPYDIYQQWPTFFAASAVLLKLTGLSALRLGAWAPLVNDLLYFLPLFAIARTLSSNRRVPYLTVFLFSIANWVAQDYFSPQAFVYGLCLGVMLILLRWLRRVPGPADRFTPKLLFRLWTWLSRDLVDVPYASKRAVRVALATLYLLYLVIATAHQLSPYLVALCATALVVLGLVSPRQLIPVLLGIAILYLVPRQNFAEEYGIFDGFNIFKNAQGTAGEAWGSAGQAFSALVVRSLSLAIWGTAMLAVIIWRRRLGPVAAPATLAFAPFVLLMAQSYGGEAIYRVFLFSLPWCAYLVAILVVRMRRIPRHIGAPLGAGLLSAAMLAGMQGSHGQLDVDLFTNDEVQASGYLYEHAQPGAALVFVTSNFPSPYTANYGTFHPSGNQTAELLKEAGLEHLALNDADLPAVEQYTRDLGGPTAYLVISRSMKVHVRYFGYTGDEALDTLNRSLAASPRWRLWYRNADVTIYQLVAPAR
jgi:O-antigen/teichoic acid export membrane protein